MTIPLSAVQPAPPPAAGVPDLPDLGFDQMFRGVESIPQIDEATQRAVELLKQVDPDDPVALAAQAQRAIDALRAALWTPHTHRRAVALALALEVFQQAAARARNDEKVLLQRRDRGEITHLEWQRAVSKVRAAKRAALTGPDGRQVPRPRDVEQALGVFRSRLVAIRRDMPTNLAGAPAEMRRLGPWRCIELAKAETAWFDPLMNAQAHLRAVRDPALRRLWTAPPDGLGMADRAIGRLVGMSHVQVGQLRQASI
jgi:hypothetical protein